MWGIVMKTIQFKRPGKPEHPMVFVGMISAYMIYFSTRALSRFAYFRADAGE
jgi:hypothetical protein